MSHKTQGRIIDIMEAQQVTEKFRKREFVIETDSEMYPQKVLFQASQDKCEMLDGFAIGDLAEVSFNLRGRDWTNPQGELKYFNTLDAWRVEKLTGKGPANDSKPPRTADDLQTKDDDDLPF